MQIDRLRIIIISAIIFLMAVTRGFSQEIKPVRLMFYNVENLFDIYDDSLKADDDFLPGGIMRWNFSRYTKKINSLYKTIISAGEWNPPVVVAFCEIENRRVLEDLVYGTNLSKFNYRIVHEDSPDQRGIDVCLIYRIEFVKLVDYRYWIPEDFRNGEFTSRSILYTKMVIGSDTVHFVVNHWPSRRGGVLAGEDLRLSIASMVRENTDSIMKRDAEGSRIIIMGDFNCTPDDQEIKSLVTPSITGSYFINMTERLASDGQGTYRFKGTWELIDQVIVSDKLINCNKGLFTNEKMLTIYKPGFLLKNDPKYPGITPFSTYRGYRYQGGISDHLPVLLDLKVR